MSSVNSFPIMNTVKEQFHILKLRWVEKKMYAKSGNSCMLLIHVEKGRIAYMDVAMAVEALRYDMVLALLL